MRHNHAKWGADGGVNPEPRVPKTCAVDGCEREHDALGWCHAHYQRWREHGDVQADKPLRVLTRQHGLCAAKGCQVRAVSLGWCQTHFKRVKKFGHPREDVPVVHKRRFA